MLSRPFPHNCIKENFCNIFVTINYSQKLLAGTLALILVAGISNSAFASDPDPPDTDGDGVFDSDDLCQPTPFGQTSDITGCSDDDGDGVFGFVDVCLETPAGATVDADGCEISVAGELLSINSSALVIAGLTGSAAWIMPAVAGIAGVGAYLIKNRMSKN